MSSREEVEQESRMEKEELKIVNKGLEDEMVSLYLDLTAVVITVNTA